MIAEYLKAFFVGAALCMIGQVLIDKTRLTPARILTLYVVAGVLLGAVGVYEPFAHWAGAGASVPLTGFGNLLAGGARKAVAERGVLVCGTGIGMAMAADKVHGVRAANIINSEFAALCREHNDANVITLSGRFVPLEENERILDTFFATDFGGGRHAGRVQKIMELD